jgi:hypothetical protein
MRADDIIDLVSIVFHPEFGLDEAARIFGQRRVEEYPGRVAITPDDERFEQVNVEMRATGVVSGVSLRFRDTVRVRFDTLEARFGTARRTPRLRPHHEVPFQFAIQERGIPGYLLVGVEGYVERRRRKVRTVIVRRFPAE